MTHVLIDQKVPQTVFKTRVRDESVGEENPLMDLLMKREEIDVDWPVIFQECIKRNIALEINAWPERLDASDSMVRSGIEKGVQFFINTDAHANEQMGNMLYGVEVARRGWASKSDIMNSRSYKEIKEWIEK